MVHPLSGLYAATRAMLDVYSTLKAQGTTRGDMEGLAHFSEFNDLIGFERAISTEERFMRRCVQVQVQGHAAWRRG